MIKLRRTCGACPEQYEAYDEDGNQVGYLRLRHGRFRVDYPDCGGETIYVASPEGDGVFADHERTSFLNHACRAIENRLGGMNYSPEYPIYELIED